MIPICLGSLWDGGYIYSTALHEHPACCSRFTWGIIRFIDSFCLLILP